MSGIMESQQEESKPLIPRDTFSARLVLLRHELGLTVDEISQRCDVASATWSTWERGTTPRNEAAVCKRIADATGYDPNWLIWGGFPLPAQCAQLEIIEGEGRDHTQPTLPFLTLASVMS